MYILLQPLIKGKILVKYICNGLATGKLLNSCVIICCATK